MDHLSSEGSYVVSSQRCLLGCLQYYGIAHCQRGTEFPCLHQQREIPLHASTHLTLLATISVGCTASHHFVTKLNKSLKCPATLPALAG